MHTRSDAASESSRYETDAAINPDFETDLYEVLQVSPRAETEVIEAAYKRLAFKYHPDRNPNAEATARMQEINAAYAVLSNPRKRFDYDRARQGLPPLEDDLGSVGATAEHETQTDATAKDDFDYNWDDLPFATPKVSPYRGWVKLKIFLYRHRHMVLPYTLTFLLLLFIISMWISPGMTGDKETANASSAVKISTGLNFQEDFEAKDTVANNWTLDNPWHLTSHSAASGSNSLWVGDETSHQYVGGLNASATLQHPLDLTQAQHPALFFKLTGQFDSDITPTGRDRLYVEVAEPGQDFQTVYTISSTFTNWQPTQVDLSNWKGKKLLLRLRFTSGTPTSGYSGPFIDDVQVREA